MALPNSGQMSLSMIQGEFGGGKPIALSEYYKNGSYVPGGSANNNIPASGTIAFSNFYGASNIVSGSSGTNYAHSAQRENDYRGYRNWLTLRRGLVSMRVTWDPYWAFIAGHWNGNVSQTLQVRRNGTTVRSVSAGSLNPSARSFNLNGLDPNSTYTFWTNASSRTGPPYGVMSARGSISVTYDYTP